MISIVIPLYNEEATLKTLHSAITDACSSISDDIEIVLVNDGSSDRSSEILDELAGIDDRVVPIHLRTNVGQTSALMAGFDHAKGDIIVCLDADMQNDPADIPRLIDKLNDGYDVVSGWRKDRKDPFLSKVLVSRIANRIISALSGVRIHDYGCSLKAYRARVLSGVRLYGEMHRFIPIYASWQGGRITEMVVTHHPRKHGTSNYGMERVFKVIMDLIVVKFLHGYSQKPMYVFGGAGLLSFLVAFAAGSLALYYKFSGQKTFIETPLPLLVAMSIITGLMCILMGLLAELVIRIYYEARERKTYIVDQVVSSEHSKD